MLGKLNQLKRRQDGKLPTDGDLETAARALTHLMEVYRLEARDVMEGRLGGEDTGAKLEVEDVYYLASKAAQWRQHQVAVEVVRAALAEDQQRHYSSQQRRILEDLLTSQEQEMTGGQKEVEHHLIARDVRMTEQERAGYSALCRGEDLLDPALRRDLLCYFSTRSDPYYTLHPIAVELLHPHPHQVLLLHHVLSPTEVEELAKLASPALLEQGAIGNYYRQAFPSFHIQLLCAPSDVSINILCLRCW